MKKHRNRSSIYDPFRDNIQLWCAEGRSVREMAEILGDGYEEQGIYHYIRVKKLRKNPWNDVYEARNKCEECEHCQRYINTNNREGRLCKLSWHTIQNGVTYCPTWCEKEKGYEKTEL